MKHFKIILLIIFVIISNKNVFAQFFTKEVDWTFKQVDIVFGENPDIIIDWVKPRQEEVIISGKEIEIELKIRSDQHLNEDNFKIDINLKSGAKADEIQLFDNNSNIYTFKGKVQLPFEVNSLVMRIYDEDDTVLRSSSSKIIHCGGSNRTDDVWAYWVDPNPNKLGTKSYKQKEQDLYVEFNINSEIDINQNNILLNVNGLNRFPSSRANFDKTGITNYLFTDYVKLDERVETNRIFLTVQLPEDNSKTQTLPVVYDPIRPNLHIVSIGPKFSNLDYTTKDAEDFIGLFKNQGGRAGNKIFNSVEVVSLLTGEKASAGEISKTLQLLRTNINNGNIGEDDVVLVFISSHGKINESGELVIQGNDYIPGAEATTVPYKKIIEWLDRIPCKKMVFIDACHSGGGKANAADINDEILKWNKSSGVSVLTSSRKSQLSFEDKEWKNGAFTKAIIEGLKYGKADGYKAKGKSTNRRDRSAKKNGIITLNELYNWMSDYIPKIVKEKKGEEQNPVLVTNQLGDVAIYLNN